MRVAVVYGWRGFTLRYCRERGRWALAGMAGCHLHERRSRPAVCRGFNSSVASGHLGHPADWPSPPPEHMDAYKQWLTFKTERRWHALPPAPHPLCTCGYYALRDPAGFGSAYTPEGQVVVAFCVALGHCVEYTHGWRWEAYETLAVYWPLHIPQGKPPDEWLPVPPETTLGWLRDGEWRKATVQEAMDQVVGDLQVPLLRGCPRWEDVEGLMQYDLPRREG